MCILCSVVSPSCFVAQPEQTALQREVKVKLRTTERRHHVADGDGYLVTTRGPSVRLCPAFRNIHLPTPKRF